MRTLACFPRAALLAAPVAYLVACSSGRARGVPPGEGLQVPAPNAVVRTSQPPEPSVASLVPEGSLGGSGAGAPPASLDARDRQFEILNEAVSALRQEASRTYERANDLARETDRLRALVASLQRRIARSREDNRELLDHVHELEERLTEVRTPAPEAVEEARPSEPQPTSQAPVSPASPPQDAASGSDDSGPPIDPEGDAVVPPPAQ